LGYDNLGFMIHGSWFKAILVQGSRLMVQGMKRQNGISKMKSINMGDDKKEIISRTGGRVPVSNGSVALEDIEEAMAEIKFSGR